MTKIKVFKNTKFIVHNHGAYRAGFHQDLRIRIAKNKWASFAVPKSIPLYPGKKVLAIRTHDHTDKEALMVGTIAKGKYGAGKLSVFDEGSVIIVKFDSAHIKIALRGATIAGIYHLISTGVVNRNEYNKQQYMLFKSKEYLDLYK
jgi:bifunctional non-homologous end joining protein LigD